MGAHMPAPSTTGEQGDVYWGRYIQMTCKVHYIKAYISQISRLMQLREFYNSLHFYVYMLFLTNLISSLQ